MGSSIGQRSKSSTAEEEVTEAVAVALSYLASRRGTEESGDGAVRFVFAFLLLHVRSVRSGRLQQ